MAVAFKQYDAAVGAKEAQVCIAPAAEDDCVGILQADYQSEGRNILSTVWYRIPANVDDAALASSVKALNREIDRKVGESNAVRLVRPDSSDKAAP